MASVKKQLIVTKQSKKIKKIVPKTKKSKLLKKKVLSKKTKHMDDSDEEMEKELENETISDDEGEPVGKYDDSENEEVDEEALTEKHRKDLEKLKKTDPEFYKFLQENDKKLLQFSLSDEEPEESAQESDDDGEESVHKPNAELDVASDESDFEAEDNSIVDERIISLKMIKKWQTDIRTDKSNKTIIELTHAFHAALKRVSGDEENDEILKYKVEASSIFNAIIQICVIELGPAIRRYLGISGSKQPPHKSKKFNKIKNILKSYLTNLLKLLFGVTSPNIQTVLLKHLHYMCPMLNSFSNITKSILTKLIKLWSSADDSVRVLAFFCILRIVTNQMGSALDSCLKSMYMSYVKNSKFVSISSLASINFMRRSLVEMFTLDLNVSYTHIFLYIRQLAIQLRNAITVNKKENIQAVYNWQFINSLRLWGNLLSLTHTKPQMQQLIYPFIQVCLGTLKLVPTAQFYPLRFHVTQILIDFTQDTKVFVPILPFLLEVLTSFDFDKKHQKLSMKPLNFTCLLRLSKSQMQENGFKDTIIDTIHFQLLEYLTSQSHTISFPDLSLVCILQIKEFIRKSRTANYTRKLKQALEKIEQNCQFIENERSKLTLQLTNVKQIEGWESQIKTKGTPLKTFFDSWSNIRNVKKNKELTNNDALADYNLPMLKKNTKNRSRTEKEVVLFPSDSDDSENELEKKPKRGKRGSRNAKKSKLENDNMNLVDGNDTSDIVQDISVDDW